MTGPTCRADAGDKLCALTFDDGPHAVQTARVLDRLQAHGAVPATFFLWAERIDAGSATVLQRMLREGHELANHSWSHADMTALAPLQRALEFQRAQDAISHAAGGRAPRFFRAPFLAVNDAVLDAVPLPFAGGIPAHDWLGSDAPTARARADKILNDPQLRDGAILLLHDVQPDPHPTPEALDLLIPALRRRGYGFVTLSDLFALKQVDAMAAGRRQWQVVV